MMMETAGYSRTPLVRKLGLKHGMRIHLVNPPDHYWTLLGESSASMGMDQMAEGSDQKADFIHLFATDLETLQEAFAVARSCIHQDGMVWASWPKKSSGIPSDIGRSEVMKVGKAVGLVDIKVCAVDEIWSGLKFVIPTKMRG
jgi:hypothetical protein